MRAEEFVQSMKEYEQDTARSAEIEKVMARAGYKRLGGGAEATAWSRKSGPVIKLIMPDEHIINTDPAMQSFKRFYKLTKKHPSKHWPIFYSMKDENGIASEFAKFRIGNRKYMQIAIEKLQELTPREEDFIDEISTMIANGMPYKEFVEEELPVIKKYNPPTYKIAQAINAQLPTLWAAIEMAYKKSSHKYEWDLHGGNVMKRANGTFVITDPFIQWAG
jgi:hypothetical protein